MPTSEQYNLIDTESEKKKLKTEQAIFNFIKRGYAEHLTLQLDSSYDDSENFLSEEPVIAEEIIFIEEQKQMTLSTKARKKINQSSNMKIKIIPFGEN